MKFSGECYSLTSKPKALVSILIAPVPNTIILFTNASLTSGTSSANVAINSVVSVASISQMLKISDAHLGEGYLNDSVVLVSDNGTTLPFINTSFFFLCIFMSGVCLQNRVLLF